MLARMPCSSSSPFSTLPRVVPVETRCSASLVYRLTTFSTLPRVVPVETGRGHARSCARWSLSVPYHGSCLLRPPGRLPDGGTVRLSVPYHGSCLLRPLRPVWAVGS